MRLSERMEMAGDSGVWILYVNVASEFRWIVANGANPSRNGNWRRVVRERGRLRLRGLSQQKEGGSDRERSRAHHEFTSSYINAVTSASASDRPTFRMAASTSGAWFRRSICIGTYHYGCQGKKKESINGIAMLTRSPLSQIYLCNSRVVVVIQHSTVAVKRVRGREISQLGHCIVGIMSAYSCARSIVYHISRNLHHDVLGEMCNEM